MLERFRRLLPTITWGGACLADREWEAEGWYLELVWGRFVIELQFAAIDREFREELPDAR